MGYCLVGLLGTLPAVCFNSGLISVTNNGKAYSTVVTWLSPMKAGQGDIDVVPQDASFVFKCCGKESRKKRVKFLYGLTELQLQCSCQAYLHHAFN